MPELTSITTPRWANMHGHLRQSDDEDKLMADIMPHVYPHYYYYTAMPNTNPPKSTGEDCRNYYEEICSFVPREYKDLFFPITPLKMLWDENFKTSPEIIYRAKSLGINWVKLYFRGTTTNSDDGVLIEELPQLFETLGKMEEYGMILLIHGEVPGKGINMDDREYLFANEHLPLLAEKFSKLKIVMEHITDRRTVEIVKQLPNTVAATITTHHLYISKNDVLEPGPRPRNACKPYAKQLEDLKAIQQAAFSGNPKFFFGDDNAWHRKWKKYGECGNCGCAHTHSVEFVTQFFAEHGKLDLLENFACNYGPDFYGIKRPKGELTIQKTEKPYFPEKELSDVLPWGFDIPLNWEVVKKI